MSIFANYYRLMKKFLKILRILIVTLLALIILIPMCVFVAFSLPSVQQNLCKTGEQELSKLLGTEVKIESLNITPINRLSLKNVTIKDDNGDDALKLSRIGAGIDYYELLSNHKIVITHATIIGLEAKLYKQDSSSPLNIQNIINALKPKQKNKPPTKFDLRINTIVIRESQASFDILSEPAITHKFDPKHIKISGLNADIHIPQLKNDDFIINIKRLKVAEKSGLNISDLCGSFHIASTGIDITDFVLSLKDSKLIFDTFNLKYQNWKDLNNKIKNPPTNIKINEGSYISLNDLSPFVPQLKNINEQFNLDIVLEGELNNLSISKLNISHKTKQIALNAIGSISGIKKPKDAYISIPNLNINANAIDISSILNESKLAPTSLTKKISNIGKITINSQFDGQPLDGNLKGDISTSSGSAKIDLDYTKNTKSKSYKLNGNINSKGINIGKIVNNINLGVISGNIDFGLSLKGKRRKGQINGIFDKLELKNYAYSNISSIIDINDDLITGNIYIDDPNLNFSITGNANIDKNNPMIDIHAEANTINFDKLNLSKKYVRLSAILDANFNGINPDNANGYINISNIHFSNRQEKDLFISHINIDAQNESVPQQISISSDFLTATIDGSYSFKTLYPAITDILSHSFPILFEDINTNKESINDSRVNNFEYYITLVEDKNLFDYFNISTELFSPITVYGEVNHPQQRIILNANIPYIAQKNKLVENTRLEIDIDQTIDKCFFRAYSILPTKHGNMPLEITCDGSNNRLDTNIDWKINRDEEFNGHINLSSLFSRDEDHNLITNVTINPSQAVFNDSVWDIQEANIYYSNKSLVVNNFDVRHNDQYISLSGKTTDSPSDILCLDLKDVNLDFIFQTLEIKKVLLGGDATGTFFISQLFTNNPIAYTPQLKVKDFRYNGSIFGDASIKAHWANDIKAISLDGIISQANNKRSTICGEISPTNQSIDLKIEANSLNIGFLAPFLNAFASDIKGNASGYAHLFGTFKNIDLEGDIFAENVSMGLIHTNTSYSMSDSIILRSGLIQFKEVTLTDVNGNTATLNGQMKHRFFRAPRYDFRITNAKNLLCYNMSESSNYNWHGRVYGNGFVTINGVPGSTNINVEMETTGDSNFTFILSDKENASEYKFLTFRDKAEIDGTKRQITTTNEPIEVTLFKEKIKQKTDNSSSIINMHFNVTVTPKTLITIVMDPISGDKIKAHGTGTIKMDYSSGNDDLKMYGSYEINDGNYNFTLQDIIIKEFKIKEKSSITFNGNPYSAKLNITALYPVKANLSDIDESFLDDTDLNNTNVLVYAKLIIKNSLTQPDIDFDLEFPTLKQDTYSKVKSIISTDELMKRQVLYLLALNRFYTPEYMNATKGNELFSVASSTISSQLSSMLGQLSNNWTISPNLRSNQGDFSDVEVDVALSSSLLNNRLKFNGNFGYRDNTLNTNQFIGDFDIEYLLNPKGSWRLKAYNRYNDQNYYLKTATTTQGIGIMYRQDFDSMLSFFKDAKENIQKLRSDSISNDSTIINVPIPTLTDSIQAK